MTYSRDELLEATFLRHIEVHEEIASTNDRAAELAKEDVTLPAIVVAERQSSGRGRGANRWWSAPGALTFSLLLNASEGALPARRWPLVALAAGLAVCEAVHSLTGIPISLKWPNDVYASGRKLCGILVESPGTFPPRLVVGIGVNVNNSFDGAPVEVRDKATAMIDLTGCEQRRSELIVAICRTFSALLELVLNDAAKLAARWRPHCLLTGRVVAVETPGGRVLGRCDGIDSEGALVVVAETGRTRLFAGTVVEWS